MTCLVPVINCSVEIHNTRGQQTSKKHVQSSTDFSVAFPNVFYQCTKTYYTITDIQQPEHNTIFRQFTVYPGRYDMRS